MEFILITLLLAALFFCLWCVAYFIEFWRKSNAEDKGEVMGYGTGWEVDYWDSSSYYFGKAPPIDYANNDSTDYIY